MAECSWRDDERGDCIREELTVKTQNGTQGGSFPVQQIYTTALSNCVTVNSNFRVHPCVCVCVYVCVTHHCSTPHIHSTSDPLITPFNR